jgi:hypothetical protein
VLRSIKCGSIHPGSINTTKKYTGTFTDDSKVVGPEVYMLLSRHQNAGQDHYNGES